MQDSQTHHGWKRRCAQSLKMYNSLSRRLESFDLRSGETVKMFVCGPTVYDYLHLGHARTYLAFDVISHYLTYLGYKVRYLMNITDIAERIVQRAAEVGKDPLEVAKEYERAFLEDMMVLGIKNVERYERASDYIPRMISQVESLIDKGVAYETETGVYFEVKKFLKFGQLSGLSAEELGLRRLELCSSKHNVEDFSLWRKHDKAGFGWDSPWGHGRPGWHLEDTAISMTNFGETYDIHGGASELMFPHHEAEIAQAEALSGKAPFVRFWLHTGLLSVRGRKMSKSLGNVIRIRDALKDYTAQELRYYFASHHYRQPVVISDAGLRLASHNLSALNGNFNAFVDSNASNGSIKNGKKLIALTERTKAEFRRCMDDDFNTPRALRALMDLSRRLRGFTRPWLVADRQSKQDAENAFRKMAGVFGILS
jgi:cysteinyl-tRNA synthetase